MSPSGAHGFGGFEMGSPLTPASWRSCWRLILTFGVGDVQAKRLLAKKKAAAQKKSATSAAALAAAREAKERAKKAKGKKDTSHFNQVRLPLSGGFTAA